MAKRALLVGINEYSNSKFNLRGCVNDIESLARLLSDVYGFGSGDFEIVRDSAATKQTIMPRLEALLSSAHSGDMLVFAFSGHGTQVASTDPGEQDMKDECLVPYEASYNALIKDNELYDLFNKYVDEHIKLTAIYDCCHSGTLMRTLGSDEKDDIVEVIINRCLNIEDLTNFKTRDVVSGPYNILAACRDNQTAADVRQAGTEKLPRGAFSYALHSFLRGSPNVPISVAESQITAGISAISSHTQVPSYTLIDQNSPLIRH